MLQSCYTPHMYTARLVLSALETALLSR